MNVTFILLSFAIVLKTVLRLKIFHKYMYEGDSESKRQRVTERQRGRAQTKQIEKTCRMTFTYDIAKSLPTFSEN